jgi:MFS family permease
MGRLRICTGLYSTCPTLWRASTGTTPNPLRECRTYLNISRHEWDRNQIIGRRPIMLTALFLFALGSAISGAASSMNMLIAGRSTSCISPNGLAPTQTLHPKAIQGLGAGAITTAMQIILSDLVALRERGVFTGLMALCVFPFFFVPRTLLMSSSSWAIGGGVGPVIGGSLAQQGQW